MRISKRLLVFFLPLAATLARAEDPLHLTVAENVQSLIPQVFAAESLYTNLELTYKTHYEYSGTLQLPGFITAYTDTAHLVVENNFYFFDHSHLGVDAENEPFDESLLTAYDGKFTRSLKSHNTATVNVGREPAWFVFRPHNFINFREDDSTLSQYLQTGLLRPNATLPAGVSITQTITLADEHASFLNHDCIILESQATWTGMPPRKPNAKPYITLDRLWLASSLHYLPLKHESYVITDATPHLRGKREVTELVEVTSGTFFPAKASNTNYESEAKILNSQTWTFEKISLNPHHASDFFANIPFPPGTAVDLIQGQIHSTFIASPETQDIETLLHPQQK